MQPILQPCHQHCAFALHFLAARTRLKLCGIAGFTHKNWVPPQERIWEAVETLHHRGPDQQGIYASDIFALAAARLKIIDLASGDQPILVRGGEMGIVFNGEIYNHIELRRELEALGHQFSTHCDTETVLRAFLQWDRDCLTRFRGMFAFAIWNKPAKRIFLARDRLGIKPLYFSCHGEDLFFGSELKALFVHPQIQRNLSLAGLDSYLATNYVLSPWTLVDGIEKVPPGSWLEWTDGSLNSGVYWDLPRGGSRAQSIEEAKEELDFRLRDAVKEHLISDVPLGIWLSGGIDSTTILHYAAEASTTKFKTFSISFRGRTFDETSFIRTAVLKYGTEHEELDLNPEVDLRGAIEEFAYYSDEPSADAGALPVWYLSKLCKIHTTVALSGEGADELFGGYLTYRADLIANVLRRLPKSLLRAAMAAAHVLPVSDEKIGFEYKVKRLLEGVAMSSMRAHLYWNGTFSEKDRRNILKLPATNCLNDVLRSVLRENSKDVGLQEYFWFDQKYYLPDDILTKSDRMSMAHSVEVRPPFLDHRLVEFAGSLPASFKIRGGHQKLILKLLMKGKLPSEIISREKIGFDIPAHEWLRGPLRDLLLETLAFGTREYGHIFDAHVVEALVKQHLERRVNAGYHLWGLLILFLWMKKWKIQIGRTAVEDMNRLAAVGLHV